MARASIAGVFQVGLDILSSIRDAATKSILLNLGNVIDEDPESGEAEYWQHVGFVSRPAKAKTANGKAAAQAVVLRTGGRDAVVATRDLRGQEIAGQLAEGEVCLYAIGEGEGQPRIILKADGSINLYTREGNTSTGQGMGIFVNPGEDSITLMNSRGHGIKIDADGLKLMAGSGAGITLDAAGGAKMISTGLTQVDGGSVVIGSMAVPGVNSAITGVTGIAGKPSLKVLIE